MSDHPGRRGGRGGGYHGGVERGRGRGRGRGEFRAIPVDEGRRALHSITSNFTIGKPSASSNVLEPELPRYDPGRIGQEARCLTNYFPIRCETREAYHYRVDLDVDYDHSRAILSELAERENWPAGWVFDGKHDLYTAGKILSLDPQSYQVPYRRGRREMTVDVKLTHTSVVNLDALHGYINGQEQEYPSESVRVIEIVLSHAVAMIPDVILHRKSVFFDVADERKDIQFGAEGWMGYHQSVKPCKDGLFINMDSSCGPFYKPIQVSVFIKEILGLRDIPRSLNSRQQKEVKDVLKGMVVHSLRGHTKAKVIDIKNPPREMMFHYNRENREISVLEYYQSIDQQLRYPDLPCLDCSRGKKLNYIPPECAQIAPAQYVRKVNEKHQEAMIRLSAQRPHEKVAYLQSLVNGRANINTMEAAQNFQLSCLGPDLKEVRARILPPPMLAYKKPNCVNIGAEGQWNLSAGNVNFLKGKKLKSWAFLSLCEQQEVDIQGENGISTFLRELSQALYSLIVAQETTDLSKIPILYSHGNADFVHMLNEAKSQARQVYGRDPDIILVMMRGKNTFLYKQIKQASDQMVCIPSQCFAADKAGVGGHRPPRGRPQYCGNLALKINVKVGGSNWTILSGPCGLPMVNQQNPYMIIGADVSHPAQRSSLPSIAAVVGTVDPQATRYCSRVTNQPAREEIILEMKESVKSLLLEFHKHNENKYLPDSIIVFRDGVSEGFFSRVIQHEFKAIVEACEEMRDKKANYRPYITFITIQKRHHTRLFPKNQQQSHHSGNIMPGTIVDSEITSPFGLDFYLCSQAGIQGTVRPAHYHVLVDENNLGSDAIQIMCYWMCYMSCRCTKSTSVPAPAIYAHLAAMRGRILAGEETDDEASLTAGVAGSGAGDVSILLDAFKNKMYYV